MESRRIILSGDRNVSLKKILLNVNIISVFVGVLLFLLNLPLPTVIAGTMKSIASTIGPLSMFVAGMLMGEQNLLAVLRIRSIWKVAFLRLIACRWWSCVFSNTLALRPWCGRQSHPDDQPAGSKCPCGG